VSKNLVLDSLVHDRVYFLLAYRFPLLSEKFDLVQQRFNSIPHHPKDSVPMFSRRVRLELIDCLECLSGKDVDLDMILVVEPGASNVSVQGITTIYLKRHHCWST
jgi:hypothetical protein